jgi:hypothetical protein
MNTVPGVTDSKGEDREEENNQKMEERDSRTRGGKI